MSLQISATKQMGHHVALNGFFVWGHEMWSGPVQGSSTAPTDVRRTSARSAGERSPTNNDIKNMASMLGIWDLSYYRGPNRWVGGVLNGWEISPSSR